MTWFCGDQSLLNLFVASENIWKKGKGIRSEVPIKITFKLYFVVFLHNTLCFYFMAT